MLKCVGCCLHCFERFVRFLNEHAYIEVIFIDILIIKKIALTGKSFCEAAMDGFFLLLRNAVRFGFVATLGTALIFIGKIYNNPNST